MAAPTVVVTGASSGLGRATALEFARRGANVVAVARGAAPLREVAAECVVQGGKAAAVPADVTDVDALRAVADAAEAEFGGLDVWVNNAGIGAIGGFIETPLEAHRRVVETNLVAAMAGAHIALERFLAQGHGTLINVISLGAWFPTPYAASYAAGKYGLRGLTESLRAELRGRAGIHICDVHPSFMDTPGISHGANYTGRRLRPMPPVHDPRQVARIVAGLAWKPRPVVMVGATARLGRLAHSIAPAIADPMMGIMTSAYLRQAPRLDVTEGNIFRPPEGDEGIVGGWRRTGRRKAAAALLGGVAAGAALTFIATKRARAA